MKDMFGEGQLAADCSSTEVSGTRTADGRVPRRDVARDGSRWGGIQVYRGAEAEAATAKKPQFGEWEARVFDIIGSRT
jgi:hypothetical protein